MEQVQHYASVDARKRLLLERGRNPFVVWTGLKSAAFDLQKRTYFMTYMYVHFNFIVAKVCQMSKHL